MRKQASKVAVATEMALSILTGAGSLSTSAIAQEAPQRVNAEKRQTSNQDRDAKADQQHKQQNTKKSSNKEAQVGYTSESTAVIEIDDVSFNVDSEGKAVATDKATGKSEVLPGSGTDKQGHAVKFSYTTDGKSLQLQAVNELQPRTNWGKCITGTAGGGISGAGTGGLGGAAVGTVTLPIVGTVGGGTVGATVGGVGGALTGASLSCFD